MESKVVDESLTRKKEVRDTILQEIYQQTKGDKSKVAIIFSDDLGINPDEMSRAIEYLKNEHLIERKIALVNSIQSLRPDIPVSDVQTKVRSVYITHAGIKKVEEFVKEPEKPTSPVVNNFNASVGAVQIGNHNTANVTQNNGLDFSEARRLIEAIRQSAASLPEEQHAEAIEHVEYFEAEIISTNPEPSRLRASVQALLSLASKIGTVAGFVDTVHNLAQWLPSALQ
jgi:DNA-binding transcriptional MocR family regulator